MRSIYIERRHLRAISGGQIAHRPTKARTEIEYPGLSGDRFELDSQMLDGAATGRRDGFLRVRIETDVDILAAPDEDVEIVGIGAIVVVAGRFHSR